MSEDNFWDLLRGFVAAIILASTLDNILRFRR